MKYKMICKRGTSFLLESEGKYYFVDPINETYFEHKDINVFLKWNYFEDIEKGDEKYLPVLEKIIANEDKRIPV